MSQQGLAEAEKSGLIPHHLLFEAFRHHVLVRDQKLHEPRDDTTGSPLLVLDPENNPRARRRNYKTYFLWDSGSNFSCFSFSYFCRVARFAYSNRG